MKMEGCNGSDDGVVGDYQHHQRQENGEDLTSASKRDSSTQTLPKNVDKEEPPSWTVMTVYLPGYTGHCPGLRENYGMTYGNATRKMLQQRRSQSAPGNRIRKTRDFVRENCIMTTSMSAAATPTTPVACNGVVSMNGHCSTPDVVVGNGSVSNGIDDDGRRSRPRTGIRDAILGFTGYVPGMAFKFGETYGKTSKDCRHELEVSAKKLHDASIGVTIKKPLLRPVRPSEEVRRILENVQSNKAARERMSFAAGLARSRPPSPFEGIDPITGYTGHIPNLAFTTGKPYCIAKEECLRKHKQQMLTTARSTPILQSHSNGRTNLLGRNGGTRSPGCVSLPAVAVRLQNGNGVPRSGYSTPS